MLESEPTLTPDDEPEIEIAPTLAPLEKGEFNTHNPKSKRILKAVPEPETDLAEMDRWHAAQRASVRARLAERLAAKEQDR